MKNAVILIADDSERVLQVLKRMLEGPHAEIVPVRDGASALRVAREKTPDLIILDVDMPGLNGFEVCTALRRNLRTRSIPILMLTGLGEVSDELKGFHAGADDYVAKPFDSKELLARVKNLMDRNRWSAQTEWFGAI